MEGCLWGGGGQWEGVIPPATVWAEGDGGELLPPKKGEAEGGSCFLPKREW